MTGLRQVLCMVAVAFAACGSSAAEVVPGAANRDMAVEVDSVLFRQDVTRVYCRILGRPHTSQRIDGTSLVVNGTELKGIDIDGVDFERYFQWEDEGVIPLELDFDPTRRARKVQVRLITVRGTVMSDDVKLSRDGKAVK